MPPGIPQTTYHVFLASPGDVNPERTFIREFFTQFNKNTANPRGIEFKVIDWENYSTAGVGRPQELINQQTLERYKSSLALVIGVMSGRFGSPTGKAESGTEEEFNWALEHWQEHQWPEIKWFFRRKPDFSGLTDPNELERAAAQLREVQAFKKRLEEGDPKVYYKHFEDSGDFREVLRNDLEKWLNEPERPWNNQPAPEPTLAPDLAHPYPLPPNFTGRLTERQMLTDWFTSGDRPVCVIEAIGGMGKSALSWFWLHTDVLGTPPPGHTWAPTDPRVPENQRPDGVLFWSFYETSANFSAFLRRAAAYVGSSDDNLSDHDRVELLLKALSKSRILLILDGFERELRAYQGYRAPYQGDEAAKDGGNDCVDLRAARFLQSAASLPLAGRILITSRLLPTELTNLAGCRHKRLSDLSPGDVVTFFKSAGVKGTRAEIAKAVAPYGGHPLSVSLLARAIVQDHRMRGDIRAAGEHTVLARLKGRAGHHILEVAYEELSTERRELLGRISAFRSPMDYEALQAVAQDNLQLDTALDELEARGLLYSDGERYDLHPIVRRHAYDRLADKQGVHGRLEEYFKAFPTPSRVESVEDLMPTIELYWQMVGAERLKSAYELLRSRLQPDPLYFRFGAYELIIELLGALFTEGEDCPPRLSDESAQLWALMELANSYGMSGRPRQAVSLYRARNDLSEKLEREQDLALGLRALAGVAQMPTGSLEAAEIGLRLSIRLSAGHSSKFWEAAGRGYLGTLLIYEGLFEEACREIESASAVYDRWRALQSECVAEGDRALLALLQEDAHSAQAAAERSRRLAGEHAVERDIIRAEWLLGWAHTALDNLQPAETHLNEALTRCRRINLIELEPSILLALARLHHDRDLALQALAIADRCGYRLNQAEIHNLLARLALDDNNPSAALDHAQQAKDYAYCDGPPHYYKPAYEEAERLLTQSSNHSTATA